MIRRWKWGLRLAVAAVLFVVPVRAQVPVDAEVADADTLEVTPPQWETSLLARLSGAQTGFHNWAEGGVNSLTFTVGSTGKAERTSNSWRQVYDTRMGFGIIRQSGTEARKAEDVLRLNSTLRYMGDGTFGTFSPTLAWSIRTQFAAGYNYDRNPFGDDRVPPVKVSDFFAPATLQQSIGLSYEAGNWFAHRLGIGGKQTLVLIERLRPLYGIDPLSPGRYQVGIESRTDIDREIATNVNVKSSLGLFAAFNNPDLPDMLWENLISMRVNSWLGVNFEFVTFYDRDVSTQLQFKEVLSVGITVVIV